MTDLKDLVPPLELCKLTPAVELERFLRLRSTVLIIRTHP